jgi:hypothetical protein
MAHSGNWEEHSTIFVFRKLVALKNQVGDVIVGGVALPPCETLWEQSRFIAKDGGLRNFLLNEPLGRSGAREMNFRSQTLWLSVPARSTVSRPALAVAPAWRF